MIHQPVTEENRQAASQHLDEILAMLAKPGGFAKLSTPQRKLLLGIVLAAVVPADKRIRNIEMERLQLLLRGSLQLASSQAVESAALAEGQLDLGPSIETIAKALPDLLGIEDRCNVIAHLWELALCDNELHTYEEKLVYKVADLSGVPRKRVAELMARAAARA